MKSALVVTYTQKSSAFFAKLLGAYSILDIVTTPSGSKARKLTAQRNFDLVVVNSPLIDETGEGLARHIALSSLSQVILVVKSELFDMVKSRCALDGVLTVSKPLSEEAISQAILMAKAFESRLARIYAENESLKQKIENIRIIDRAKSMLMRFCSMSENEAHRYIEKRAMDTRTSRQDIASKIIQEYE